MSFQINDHLRHYLTINRSKYRACYQGGIMGRKTGQSGTVRSREQRLNKREGYLSSSIPIFRPLSTDLPGMTESSACDKLPCIDRWVMEAHKSPHNLKLQLTVAADSNPLVDSHCGIDHQEVMSVRCVCVRGALDYNEQKMTRSGTQGVYKRSSLPRLSVRNAFHFCQGPGNTTRDQIEDDSDNRGRNQRRQ